MLTPDTNVSVPAESMTDAVSTTAPRSSRPHVKFTKDGGYEWRGFVKLKPTRKNSDILVFEAPFMGNDIEMIGIINIPDESQTKAPAYLKLKKKNAFNGKVEEIQFDATAYLKQTKDGSGDIMCLQVVMFGLFEFVVIANIPDEGRDRAPYYLKFKQRDSGAQLRNN